MFLGDLSVCCTSCTKSARKKSKLNVNKSVHSIKDVHPEIKKGESSDQSVHSKTDPPSSFEWKKQSNSGWNLKPALGYKSKYQDYKPNPSLGSNTNRDNTKSLRPYFNNNCEQEQHFNEFQKTNSNYNPVYPEYDRPHLWGHYGSPRGGRGGRGNRRWLNPNHGGNYCNCERDKECELNQDRDRDCFRDDNSHNNKKQGIDFPS